MLIDNSYFLIAIIAVSFIVIIYLWWRLLDLRKPSQDTKSENDVIPFSLISEVVEQERSRISGELHDELGTLLSVIHLDLELVMHEASSLTPYGENRLIEVRKNLQLVIGAIRNNIWNLSSQMFDQVDLAFALRELCHKLDGHKGTHITFVQSGVLLKITEKQKLNIFRIVQELLTNSIKHSSAWNISVHLDWEPDGLSVIVEDDGVSYSSNSRGKNDGIGVLNMSKRASYIGATIRYEDLAKGHRVTVSLKCTPGKEHATDAPKLFKLS